MNRSILRTATRTLSVGKSYLTPQTASIGTSTGSTATVKVNAYLITTTSNTTSNNGTILPSNNHNHNHNHIKTQHRTFKTRSFDSENPNNPLQNNLNQIKPGSKAFADCETDAIQDLFYQFAQRDVDDNEIEYGGVDDQGSYLSLKGVEELLRSIGETPDDETLQRIFNEADLNEDGKLHLDEFLIGADIVLGGAPARIVIVVGGPGSGKGILCDRLAEHCGVVHLSSGELLRAEVEKGTPLGLEVAEIMKRGELVSSAVITALIRRRTRKFPGRRVLLDGFPRSVENAHDFLNLMGQPELALHLDCDDTILMERIIKRQREGEEKGKKRADDNLDTAIQRLRTFHKYHHNTMDWLREQHVPIVNLDCSGTPENVWNQLLAIGRLMRPAAQLSNVSDNPVLFDDGDTKVTGT